MGGKVEKVECCLEKMIAMLFGEADRIRITIEVERCRGIGSVGTSRGGSADTVH